MPGRKSSARPPAAAARPLGPASGGAGAASPRWSWRTPDGSTATSAGAATGWRPASRRSGRCCPCWPPAPLPEHDQAVGRRASPPRGPGGRAARSSSSRRSGPGCGGRGWGRPRAPRPMPASTATAAARRHRAVLPVAVPTGAPEKRGGRSPPPPAAPGAGRDLARAAAVPPTGSISPTAPPPPPSPPLPDHLPARAAILASGLGAGESGTSTRGATRRAGRGRRPGPPAPTRRATGGPG